MMAVVVLTENQAHTILDQVSTAAIMLLVVGITFGCMRCSSGISRLIGNGGASIVSRVMGLILASVAANSVLSALLEISKTGQL